MRILTRHVRDSCPDENHISVSSPPSSATTSTQSSGTSPPSQKPRSKAKRQSVPSNILARIKQHIPHSDAPKQSSRTHPHPSRPSP